MPNAFPTPRMYIRHSATDIDLAEIEREGHRVTVRKLERQRRMRQILLAFALVMAITFGAMAQPISHEIPVPAIVVTGHAEVMATPDRATVRLGAVSEAKEAAAAQDAVNQT